jgi:crotonobetainyl-CoA:carnitine CoA-transferase CaiB-like acyl-CoA transferase
LVPSAALHHRKANGGKGQVVDVALYEAVFAVMESLIPEYSKFGFVRERSGGSLPGIAPSNTYPCGDGSYVVIAGQQRRDLQAADEGGRPARIWPTIRSSRATKGGCARSSDRWRDFGVDLNASPA